MSSNSIVMVIVIFFNKWIININLNCYIPFDYDSVLSYNLRNEENTLFSILIKKPGCPKQVLSVLGKLQTSKIGKF